jgi:predicted regulator of Ras-like GTPase activity (Roadblock/LC7/MglB family)
MPINLSGAQLDDIGACLNKLRREGHARYALVADITGQLIESQGQSGAIDPAVLSALAAGEIAATREIAQLMDEAPGFKLLLHEGQKQSIYLSDVSDELLLAAIFSNDTPIGLVRLVTRMTVERLNTVLVEHTPPPELSSAEMADDFGSLLQAELEQFFG